jgi:hypothetical protein
MATAGTLSPRRTIETVLVPRRSHRRRQPDVLRRPVEPVRRPAGDQGSRDDPNDDFAFLSIDNVAGSEPPAGTADFLFTVRLSNPSERDVRVSYSTSNVTARAGADYIGIPAGPPSTLVIPAGALSRTVAVRVLPDAADEGPEAFLLILHRAEHAFIKDAIGVGTIR